MKSSYVLKDIESQVLRSGREEFPGTQWAKDPGGLFFGVFFFLVATPMAYGSSQARD